MFAPDPHTLLAVGRPPVLGPGLALEDSLELVHAGVSEGEGLVVRRREDGAGGDDDVILASKIVQKQGADFTGGRVRLCENSGTEVVPAGAEMLTIRQDTHSDL